MTSRRSATVLAAGLAALLAGCSSGKPTAATSIPASSPALLSAPAEVSFNGVTVTGAADLTAKPTVLATSGTVPVTLQVKDLVTGSGAAATPQSTVTIQYVGLRYADGKQFEASWDSGGATSFSLRAVVPGFTQGIGGAPGIEPMKAGGRRILIVPASLAYGRAGSQDGSIPPNAPIVFVVDLIAAK